MKITNSILMNEICHIIDSCNEIEKHMKLINGNTQTNTIKIAKIDQTHKVIYGLFGVFGVSLVTIILRLI